MNDIVAAFHEYFEIVVADTPELLKEAFSLRYYIWCITERYFDASSYQDQLEKDEFDERSVHILLRHRSSDTFVGTARLILSNSKFKDSKLPIELHTHFYSEFTDFKPLRPYTAEISRLAIRNDFLKRKEDLYFGNSINTMENFKRARGRRFPHPMLALMVGLIQICAKLKIYYWFSAMTPALNRLLGFYGMQHDPIGPFVDYYGLRRPYYISLFDMLERMFIRHPDIWELVTDSGRIWPVNLEELKLVHRHKQDLPNNYVNIMTC
jgi:N-acyl amino acid synthase of PEP-CTERM/exosortase system